jgi:hypothetical protein
MVFAYFAPEVALPVASVLAASVGFLMLVGRSGVRMVVRGVRSVGRGCRSLVKKLNV